MKTFQKQISSKLFLTILLSGLVCTSLAQTIQPYQAKTIQPYKAKTIQIDKPNSTTHNSNTNTGNNSSSGTSLDYFFGLYQYWVQGTSYVTANYSNQQLVIHNSAGTGVLPGGINILPNNTYIWNSSWDKKIIRGTWRTTGDQGWPIELTNAQEGRNWKVGKSKDSGTDIYVWDGNTWYNGKRIQK